MKLKDETINTTIVDIGNTPINAIKHVFATIQLRLHSFKKGLLFLVMDKITEQLPMIKLDDNNFKIPQQLQLADPSYHTPGNIDILLGASIFWNLLCNEQLHHSPKLSVLQKTVLGWIISGTMEPLYKDSMKMYCGMSVNQFTHVVMTHMWAKKKCHN